MYINLYLLENKESSSISSDVIIRSIELYINYSNNEYLVGEVNGITSLGISLNSYQYDTPDAQGYNFTLEILEGIQGVSQFSSSQAIKTYLTSNNSYLKITLTNNNTPLVFEFDNIDSSEFVEQTGGDA